MPTRTLAIAALVAAAGIAEARACTGATGGEAIRGKELSVQWQADPQPIPVGRHFRLNLLACTAQQTPYAGNIAVDANMPMHRHGMNYRATVRNEGGGRYVAEGLLFHMPGRWQIVIDADSGQDRERLVTELEVE